MGQESPVKEPGFSFASAVVTFARDLADLIDAGIGFVVIAGGPLWAWLAAAWDYLMSHPPAMILLTGLIAAIIAIRSISSSRQMSRLTTTFNMAHGSIWDEDFIKARTDFRKLRNKLASQGVSISKLAAPQTKTPDKGEKTEAADTAEDLDPIAAAIVCNTILNDYENMSLGIQNHILDEEYLHAWTHALVQEDFHDLKPLIDAYLGAKVEGSTTYIEFEKLADSWARGRSLRTGRKLLPRKGRKKPRP